MKEIILWIICTGLLLGSFILLLILGTVLISVIGVNEVNVSSLSNGIYIAKIKTSGTTFVRQIVKQ